VIEMNVLKKYGNEITIIFRPSEQLEVGENLILTDRYTNRGLIVQVIEENLVDLPGILEDVVRKEAISERIKIDNLTSTEANNLASDIANMRLARAKIRKEIRNGEILPWMGWTPSRDVKIEPLPESELMRKLGIGADRPIEIGTTIYSKAPFKVSVSGFQGINSIFGSQGKGKSHVAKSILKGLIDNGAQAIVFDINDEYSALRYLVTGEKSEYYDRIITLEPNPPKDSEYKPLKFTLDYIGLNIMYKILTELLNLPVPSASSFRTNWNIIKGVKDLDPDLVESRLLDEGVTKMEVEAIRKRIELIRNTGIITSDPNEETKIEDLLEEIKQGGAIIPKE